MSPRVQGAKGPGGRLLDLWVYSALLLGTACGDTTSSPIRDGAPAWSPDSKQIAFYSEVNGKPADLYVINVDGTGLRQLTDTPVAEGYPAWSPDGSQIAYESHTTDGNFDVYVMRADGTDVRRLTTEPKRDVGPAWSPDGKTIVFMSDRDGKEFNLYQMAADGSAVTRLTQGETDWFPQFAPGGGHIAFHRWNDVHVMDMASREVRALTKAPDNGMYPSWSPDGARLAFMSWRGGPTAVYTMNADGSDQRQLVRMSVGSAIDPRWSPDGASILFVHVPEQAANDAQAATQSRHIYLADAKTGAIRRIR